MEEDDEDAEAAFITDEWVFMWGSPSCCIRGTWQEAILKWGAFPQALSHPWHLGIHAWLCVECLGWRVGAWVSAQKPNCLRSPATCFPLLHPYPFLSQFDPISHLPIHLKAQNTYWDPIWGWGREHERALSRSGKNSNNNMMKRRWWKRLSAWTGDGFKWLSSFLSSFFTVSVSPPVFPLWCTAHWGEIGKYSPIDPAVAARREFEQETVCGCKEGSVWGVAIFCQYFTLSRISFRLSSTKGAEPGLNFESWLCAFENSKNIHLCINAKSKPDDFMFYVWPLGLTGGRILHLRDARCGWKGETHWQRELEVSKAESNIK